MRRTLPRFGLTSSPISRLGLGLCLLAACDFGGIAQPDNLAQDGGCVDTARPLAGVEAQSSLGFSAAQLLARVEGEHVSPMVWAEALEEGDIRVEFNTTPGMAELRAVVRYLGGEVREVSSEPEESGFTLGGGAGGCPDYLEVDVEIELVSDDGALAETLPATLRSWDPRFGKVDLELPLDALEGSLAVRTVEPAHARVVDPSLQLGLSQLGLSGGIEGGVELESGDAVGFGVLPIASWPTAERPCAPNEAAAKIDGAFGEFTAAEVLARINAVEGAKLSWSQGLDVAVESAFEIAAEHQGDPVCFRAIPEDDGLDVGQLHTRAEFSASAADGSMDGNFEVEVYAEPAKDGSLGDVRIDIYAPYASTVELATFAELYGIEGIDLAGYDRAGLTFSGVFTADGAASGALTVLGVTDADCADNAPGEPCEGADIRELAMAEWSNQSSGY